MADEFLRYIRPDRWWSADATVSSGSIDPDYEASWLCDLQPSYPIRTTSGSLSATISNPLGVVDAIIIANHNLPAGTLVQIGGDISQTLTAPTVPPDGIPLSFYEFVGSPATADSFTVSITGVATDIVIGELIAGQVDTIRLPLMPSHVQTEGYKNIEHDVDISSVLPYDKGIAMRTFGGTYLVTEAELDQLKAWFQAQRGCSRPSVIIPDHTVNDAWVVRFKTFRYQPIVSSETSTARLWSVDLLFEEYPRSRW